MLAVSENLKHAMHKMFQSWRISWRVRWLVAAIVAAVVTPPDPWSMTIVWIPLLVLGEIVAMVLGHSRSASEHEAQV